MTALWIQNLAAHWVQAGMLVAAAAVTASALRVRHPAVRLLLWQAVLALVLLLPAFQPWRSIGVPGPDRD